MKQLAFMIAMTGIGTLGVFVISPFCGVAIYFLFAVLRPHYIWQWSLPPGIAWSFYVALCTILAAVGRLAGMSSAPAADDAPAAPEKRTTRVHVIFGVFASWIVLTYVTASNREAAEFAFVEYLKIFVMFYAAVLLIDTVAHVWRLLLITAGSLAYIAYEVNFLYFFNNNYLGIYHNGYGGLDNNGAGLMLAMAVPLCFCIWEAVSRWWRWAFAAFVPVLLHAVLMTYSRGAMVSLVVMSPLLLLRTRRRGQFGAAMLVLMFMVPIMAGGQIRERFFSTENYEEDGSAQSRFGSWKAAWAMALDHPILGVGVRNSNLFSYQYGADLEGRTIHSQYLQLLADSGFPGLLLYLSLLGSAWLSLRQARRLSASRSTEQERIVYGVACAVEGSLAVFCTGALFLSLEIFELPYLLVLLAAQLPVVAAAHVPKVRVTVNNLPARPAFIPRATGLASGESKGAHAS